MPDRGSLTVETALVLPVLLVVVLAAFEVFTLASLRIDLVAAAREGARVAATVPDVEEPVRVVHETLGEELAQRVRVNVRRPSVVGRQAVVTVSINQPLRTPLLDRLSIRLQASAAMRVER
jgi:hypothetical protein